MFPCIFHGYGRIRQGKQQILLFGEHYSYLQYRRLYNRQYSGYQKQMLLVTKPMFAYHPYRS